MPATTDDPIATAAEAIGLKRRVVEPPVATATAEAHAPDVVSENWRAWIPPGWPEPADEDLIGRDELLAMVRQRGVDLTPRTLQLWENQGIVPRPVRRWHDGAVRALYAPWVADIVEVVAYRRRGPGRWSVDDTRKDARDRVAGAIFTHGMNQWDGKPIPVELCRQLQELARVQERVKGATVPVVEIRFLDAEDRSVADLRIRLDAAPG